MKLPSKGLVLLTFLALILLQNTSIQAAEKGTRPAAIIYLAAEVGCYSATFISSKTISTISPKRIYPVECTRNHHYEVFWSGKFRTRPGDLIPNSKESSNFCLQKSKDLKFFPRNSSSYNYEFGEDIGVGNWLPDRGPEALRFPKRLICYVGLAANSFRNFKQINQPLIKGLI